MENASEADILLLIIKCVMNRAKGGIALIEVTNLTKKYGDHVAVDHLSFRVEKGQIYGFLGPNGAGKSTTMNIITGYLAATEGTVTINGKDIQKEPEEAKRSIGYLPELPPVYTDMTVWEYLKFAAELKKVPGSQRSGQVIEVMEMTGISDMKNRLIKNLSKGYRQRVGLAQAILGYPEVIILDEPTVGLDPKQIIEIRDLIRKLGENHTVILSSHILSEVSAVCDHILIIAHGKLVASDSPEGLQKLMSGAAQLQLEVRGEYDRVQEVLASLPGVETVENRGKNDSGCAKLEVKSTNDADIREDIFYCLAENKLPILSMQYSCRTLEDIFLELTDEAAALKAEEEEKSWRLKHSGKKKKKIPEDGAYIPSEETQNETSGEEIKDGEEIEDREEINDSAQIKHRAKVKDCVEIKDHAKAENNRADIKNSEEDQ